MGYLFDPHVLLEMARGAVGQPIDRVIDQVVGDLSAQYPGKVLERPDWVFNNAGGAMGAMRVLHASLTEYVIIFGTAVGTEGATGRFAAEDYFIMLEGEHWCFAEGDLHKTVTRPGEMSVLRRGEAKAYRLPDTAWALEYARGSIPLMLPFGLADTVTSTLDWSGLGRTMKIYGQAVLSSASAELDRRWMGTRNPASRAAVRFAGSRNRRRQGSR